MCRPCQIRSVPIRSVSCTSCCPFVVVSPISEFVVMHAFKSTGDVECDQFHEGTGFMAHHFALTVAFESSIRSVNPAVTVPYWDYTRDSATTKETQMGLDSTIFRLRDR